MSHQSDSLIIATVLQTARRLGIERKRQRRHGGGSSATWSPATDAHCFGWFAARLLSGLSDGDPIASCTDYSLLANPAIQATLAKKPTYKTNRVNGLPSILFDGSDDILQSAAFASGTLSQPITAYLVVKYTTAAAKSILHGLDFINRVALAINSPGANNLDVFAGSDTTTVSGTLSTWQIWEIQWNAGSSFARIGTASPSANVSAGSNVLGGITLGSNFSGTATVAGELAEVLYFNAAASVVRANAYALLSGVYAL